MLEYLMRRIIGTVPVLLGLSLLIFLLLRALPGDPALLYAGPEVTEAELADLHERMGLDLPIFRQYLSFISQALKGDLGTSLRSGRTVLQELATRMPISLELAFLSLFLSSLIGVGFGILSAIKPKVAGPLYILSLIGISTPVYWSGLLLILFFSVHLGWFPPTGGMGWLSLVLPVLTLGAATTSSLFRLSLTGYQEVAGQEYMQVAKAKGLGSAQLHLKHGLRNVLIPLVTFIGLECGNLLGGAVLTESVFSLNGVGRYLVTAVAQRDYPVIQGAVLLLCVLFTLLNIVVDLLYLVIDPRTRDR